MQNNIGSTEPIKGLRLIVDVSYIDGIVSESEMINMISHALQKRLMVNELACGRKVLGFSTDYHRIRSELNDNPTFRTDAVQLRSNQVSTEADLFAFANNWDQGSVADIPAVLTDHFAGFLELDRIAQSVPPDLRGDRWLPSGYGPYHGIQLMAVDQAGFALVQRSMYCKERDVDYSEYSVMALSDAIERRKEYPWRSPCEPTDAGCEGDTGLLTEAFDSPRG